MILKVKKEGSSDLSEGQKTVSLGTVEGERAESRTGGWDSPWGRSPAVGRGEWEELQRSKGGHISRGTLACTHRMAS